ncbi:MAG: class I SAM-dependent methyltransferase [Deltaproteobacteria bacterium]|nr:class I SAM-dependent methyltransferase [Deltaproteobacteria bacterium]
MVVVTRSINLLRNWIGPNAKKRRKAAKREAKRQRFDNGSDWNKGSEIATRQYRSYDDYVRHQASKLDKVAQRLNRNRAEELEEFRERFELCDQLEEARNVLCLGARLGSEVEALHRLGYFAVGLDLNPGNDNPYVLPGDFHSIAFPDDSVDAIYSNAIDHAFDIETLIGEIVRILRPRGIFIAEIETGFEEGHAPGAFESMHWRNASFIIERMANAGPLEIEKVHDLGQTRRNQRKLIVYRNP